MRSCVKQIERRKFLRIGITGGVAFAALPLWKFFSFESPVSDYDVCYLSNDSFERLLKVALQYGGEFADACVKPKLRRGNHGCI